jgi:hypothetical protein
VIDDDPPPPLDMATADVHDVLKHAYRSMTGYDGRDRLLVEILDALRRIDAKLERAISSTPKADPP